MSDKIRTDDILRLLRNAPATSYELSLLLKVSHSFAANRLSRLKMAGQVELTEELGQAHPATKGTSRKWRACGG